MVQCNFQVAPALLTKLDFLYILLEKKLLLSFYYSIDNQFYGSGWTQAQFGHLRVNLSFGRSMFFVDVSLLVFF